MYATVSGVVGGIQSGDAITKIEIVWMSGTETEEQALVAGRVAVLTAAADITAFQGSGCTVSSPNLVSGQTYTPAVRVTESRSGVDGFVGGWTRGGAFATSVVAGFTDSFGLADGSAPDLTYWTSIYYLNQAKLASGSYFNVQGGTLKAHAQSSDGTLTRQLYYSAAPLPMQAGRYLEWTYATGLSNIQQTHFMLFIIYNADDCAPEAGTGRPTKNCVFFYLAGYGGAAVQGTLSGVDPSGVETDSSVFNPGSGAVNVGGKTYRMELVDATHVRLLVNGVESLASFAHTANLGTNIKCCVQMLSAITGGFSFDIAVDNVSFK